MFIESVRARATCNTIISSHPVSSHRPCTSAQLFPLLCSRVSLPFLADFFSTYPCPFPLFAIFPLLLLLYSFIWFSLLSPVRFFIPTLSLRSLFGSRFSSPRPPFLRILSIFSSSVFLFPPISTPTCVRFFASPGFVSLHLIPSLHDVHSILSHLTEVSRHLTQPSHSPLFYRQGSFISGSGQRKSRPS